MSQDAVKEKRVEAILGHVFGHTDSDSDSEDNTNVQASSSSQVIPQVHAGHVWKRIDGMNGLWVCKNFMTVKQQDQLLYEINAEGWFVDEFHNQAMRFKDLPRWAVGLSDRIYQAICAYIFADDSLSLYSSSQNDSTDFPLNLGVLSRVPLFDQMIVNQYHPSEGICAHVDLLQFEDGIAILSLQSACVMHFAQLFEGSSSCHPGYLARHPKEIASRVEDKLPILLEPGDLILLSGEARYKWTHEINRSEESQVWKGERITQSKRISVTLRKLVTHNEGK